MRQVAPPHSPTVTFLVSTQSSGTMHQDLRNRELRYIFPLVNCLPQGFLRCDKLNWLPWQPRYMLADTCVSLSVNSMRSMYSLFSPNHTAWVIIASSYIFGVVVTVFVVLCVWALLFFFLTGSHYVVLFGLQLST